MEVEADDDNGTNENILWIDGNRIVNLKVLAEGLSACKTCKTGLQLNNTVGETRAGNASWLTIQCVCGEKNRIKTSDTHPTAQSNKSGRSVFDINTKIAAAILHCGIGPTTLRRFMHSIGIPTISESSLKEREREIGPCFEKLALESCKESLMLEAEAGAEITASFDAGWQSRSSGKSYNSMSFTEHNILN